MYMTLTLQDKKELLPDKMESNRVIRHVFWKEMYLELGQGSQELK